MKMYLPMAVLAFLFVGCDPGYFYRPVNDAGVQSPRLEVEIRGVTVGIGEFETLVGARSVAQWVSIRNDSSVDAVLLGGTLRSKQTSFFARLPGDGELVWRTVPAGESKEIYCLVDLIESGGYAETALDTNLTWEWEIQTGDEKRTIQMQMVRVQE